MKNAQFKLSTLSLAVALAIPVAFSTSLASAAEPYPALPPTLSNSVTPNVMLHIDNSRSMNDRPAGSSSTTPRKIQSARTVAKSLLTNNPTLRWGLFTFFNQDYNTTSGQLRGAIGTPIADLRATIDTLTPMTYTPLGEALFEISNYFAGESSYFRSNTSYTSPIQYRCQKNFVILLTDGTSTMDNELPGLDADQSGSYKAPITYRSYDASGNALTRNFSACRSASGTPANSIIDCVTPLEGSSETVPFYIKTDPGSSTVWDSYLRSVRDVAKYSFDRDFRVGGTDLDTKSFDDPKFRKQNLTTYTVAFDLKTNTSDATDNLINKRAIAVLTAAASVGGGKFYAATDEASLSTALSAAVDDIVASVSNAGGVATRSEVAYASNVALQPVFNPKGWYGELRCKTLDKNGNITGDCTPAKAIIPAENGRKIYTSQVTGTGASFFDFSTANLNSMSTSQQNGLGANLTERQNTINWIRGIDVTGLRTRPNGKLGDMIDAQPTIVATSAGSTPDADYEAFKKGTESRNMALVGANDGMMHAFNIGTMTELMGYVPHAVYRNLKSLPKTDYGLSGGTPHAFFVNGSSKREDVKINGTWKTLLAGGLGQGGQGYFALDVTSEKTLTDGATSAVKWEWNDQRDAQLGYSFSNPIIYNVRTSATGITPAVIFGNGYENDWDDTDSGGQKTTAKSSALFVVNASTGALIQKIEVKNGSTQLGSGLSSPAGWDYDSDGILDYVYAGDINGKVWRFDLTSSTYTVSTNPLFDAGTTKPIVQRPGLFPTGNNGEVMVIFGSGKMLTDSDRGDTNTQTLYGVLDTFTSNVSTAAASSLVEQTIVNTYTVGSGSSSSSSSSSSGTQRVGTYRKMSANEVGRTRRGWYVNLPSGERLLTSPMVYADKVLFGTGNVPSGQVCQAGGAGWIMGLNPLTGSTPKSRSGRDYSFVDINGNDKSDTGDQLAFSDGAAYAVGFDRSGMPTELTFVSDTSPVVEFTKNANGETPGQTIALREVNSMGVFRADGSKNSTKYYSSGKGVVLSGTIGTDTIDRDKMLGPASGVRVETGTWKELK